MNKIVTITDEEGNIIQEEFWKSSKNRCPFCPGLQLWENTKSFNTYFCSRCGKAFMISIKRSIPEIKKQRLKKLANTPKQLSLFKEKE